MIYTLEGKVVIVYFYFKNDGCARRTIKVFNHRYPNNRIAEKHISEIIKKFRAYGIL